MRLVRTAVIILPVALALGCASRQKQGDATAALPKPPRAYPFAGPTLVPLPGPLLTPPGGLPYALRRTFRTPLRIAGNLDVPLRQQWKYIVIHHSATDEGSANTFDRFHKERGWRGVGYDFVIGNGNGSADGLVEVTFRWEEQVPGAHAGDKEYNEYGIGICLVGDFDNEYPTPRQMQALVALVNGLQERCRIPTSNVLMHRQVRPGGTHCPGRYFPFYEFVSLLDH
jgi:N-acetylmuramoyl-L-alanine amidase